jgi:hypothetical protein
VTNWASNNSGSKHEAGEGLEDFYRRLGWQEIGRWPGALRFDHGDRDEVLMLLTPL